MSRRTPAQMLINISKERNDLVKQVDEVTKKCERSIAELEEKVISAPDIKKRATLEKELDKEREKCAKELERIGTKIEKLSANVETRTTKLATTKTKKNVAAINARNVSLSLNANAILANSLMASIVTGATTKTRKARRTPEQIAANKAIEEAERAAKAAAKAEEKALKESREAEEKALKASLRAAAKEERESKVATEKAFKEAAKAEAKALKEAMLAKEKAEKEASKALKAAEKVTVAAEVKVPGVVPKHLEAHHEWVKSVKERADRVGWPEFPMKTANGSIVMRSRSRVNNNGYHVFNNSGKRLTLRNALSLAKHIRETNKNKYEAFTKTRRNTKNTMTMTMNKNRKEKMN